MTNLFLSLLVWACLMVVVAAAGSTVVAGAWVAQSAVELVRPRYSGRHRGRRWVFGR